MGSPTALTSGTLSAGTTTVVNRRSTLNGVLVQPGAIVTIYDNASAASGNVLFVYNNPGANTESVIFVNAIRAENGLTVVVAATTANIYYDA